MVPYVIRAGDYLEKIAHRLGFPAEEIWNDAKNEDLRKQRPDPNVLASGDILYVPATKKPPTLPIKARTSNTYVATVPAIEVGLAFHKPDGTPLANATFEIRGLVEPPPEQTKTDGSGNVKLKVPVTTREVVVVFPDEGVHFAIDIGGLDPHGEDSGIKHRLQNLGLYFPGSRSEDEDAAAMANAIRAFQTRKGLAVTGELDETTKNALLGEHGS